MDNLFQNKIHRNNVKKEKVKCIPYFPKKRFRLKIIGISRLFLLRLLFVLLTNGQLWVIIEDTASLTRLEGYSEDQNFLIMKHCQYLSILMILFKRIAFYRFTEKVRLSKFTTK